MKIEILSSWQEVLALRTEWERLWALQPRAEVFQHFSWVEAFVESFSPPLGLSVLVARESDAVVGILPLTSQGDGAEWRLAGSPNADYQDLLVEPDLASNVLRAFFRELAALRVRSLILEELGEHSILLGTLRQIGGGISIKKSSLCHYAELTDETVSAVRRRSGIRDNERRLAKLGTVEMRILEHAQERETALETLFEQHRSRWNTERTSSQFNAPEFCEFYRRLCRSSDLAPMLHFSVLVAGGRIVACHLGFVIGGRFIYYKPTYDITVKGAGQVLMSRLMAEARRLGLKEFDFTRGGEAYKAALAGGARQSFEARWFLNKGDQLLHQIREGLRAIVPRDADGLAFTTKALRGAKSLFRKWRSKT
jgi:CelD/BcsL family acetyltransferase involved in cellulose biosynthesis